MELPRREFIGVLAGVAAGAATGVAGGRKFSDALNTANQPLYPPRGAEQFVMSVCTACPGGCGVRARRIGDRVVKIDGNPLHPISGGRLCAKGQAQIQMLYHPDRVRQPLRRNGPRGSIASFKPASWDDALAELGDHLRALRSESRPESLVLLHEGSSGIGVRLARRFVEAFGSPNAIELDRGNSADRLALFLTQGIHALPSYDFRAADYVLSIGYDMLEASPSPVFTARAYGDFRQMRAAHRGKFVYADPRLSITGASADEWIPIKPRTHGVFALGIAAVIVSEELYDREFVAEHCAGFDVLRILLREQFDLESVASRTGVNVNTILRVAREVAGAGSPLILGPRKGPLLPGRLFDHLAAHALNGLVGSIDRPGGVLAGDPTPLAPWPAIPRSSDVARLDGADRDAPGDPEQLAIALASGKPYRAEVLLLADVDPVFTTAGGRFREAIEHVPLVVSFATVANDTALHADWILPEPHFLEQSNLVSSPPGIPFASAGIAQPATAPHGDVRPVGAVILTLAERIGLHDAFPWPDVDTLLRAEMDGLYAARRGALMGTAFDEAWVRMMEGAGWWAPGYANAEELWSRSRECGGWWDPFYDYGDWSRVLRTPSGRFEFRADLLRAWLYASPADMPQSAALDVLLFEPLTIAGGKGAELPFLQSLLDPGHGARWETWGEIHPETARTLGIRDGTRIRLASVQGSIDVVAKFSDRVVRGAIAVPLGLGHEGGGRWARGIGSNPLRLLTSEREPVSSRLDFSATRVLVTPVRGI